MRPNIHNVLYRRAPVTLAVFGSIFILTLPFVPFSLVYLSIAIGVGLLDSIISIDELTGGKMLSWFSVPLLLIGQIAAAYVAGLNENSLRLMLQFIVLVFCIELVVTLIFRRRIERFVTAKRQRTMPKSLDASGGSAFLN